MMTQAPTAWLGALTTTWVADCAANVTSGAPPHSTTSVISVPEPRLVPTMDKVPPEACSELGVVEEMIPATQAYHQLLQSLAFAHTTPVHAPGL